MPKDTLPIPGPTALPVIRCLHHIDIRRPAQSLTRMASQFPGIFRMQMPNANLLVLTSQELVSEVCDEARFEKKLSKPLEEIRAIAGDGLFTARNTEANWGIAHRILMPTFGPAALRDLMPGMQEIAEQLCLKWERMGPGHEVDIADEMTRLTLDTIALTAFGFRFNSFYDSKVHPFVDAMDRALNEAGLRARRPRFLTRLFRSKNWQYKTDQETVFRIADQLVEQRRKDPERHLKNDLLTRMLDDVDPETGAQIPSDNIRYQMVTFLVAGHETTSGWLAFTLYELLRNPEALAKARAEVESKLGGQTPRFEDLPRLTYLDQVLKETLRLWPTAPAFALRSREGATTVGPYTVEANETLLVLAPALHRDPKVWEQPELFRPERMAPEAFAKLPPHSWKPFGNGVRACIGRGFAYQEATLVLAMILDRFDFELCRPDLPLDVIEPLTLKPHNLKLRIWPRKKLRLTAPRTSDMQTVLTPASLGEKWTGPIAIHYGSNAGTAESFARRLKSQLAGKGVDASTGILNAAVEKLDPQTLHVLICASYEGRPPHNAKRFFKWMEGLPEEALAGVPFAVFGCGNRDWHRTYQAVPKTLSEQLRRAGAREILARGEGDASQNIFQDFELWSHDVLNLIPSAVEGGGQTVPRSTERTLSSH